MTVASETEPGAEPVETPEPGDEPVETPEPGDEPDEPQEPGDEPTDTVSDQDIEKAMDKLEREATRHADRISQIMGEDAQVLVPCPLCSPGVPGFRFPIEPDDETKTAVRLAIGDIPAEGFKDSPDAQVCAACDGLGRQLTGSKVPEHRTKLCSRCNGAGWLDITKGPDASPVAAGDGRAPVDEPHPEDIPDIDPFGRKRGDPLFGIFPGYEAGRA